MRARLVSDESGPTRAQPSRGVLWVRHNGRKSVLADMPYKRKTIRICSGIDMGMHIPRHANTWLTQP